MSFGHSQSIQIAAAPVPEPTSVPRFSCVLADRSIGVQPRLVCAQKVPLCAVTIICQIEPGLDGRRANHGLTASDQFGCFLALCSPLAPVQRAIWTPKLLLLLLLLPNTAHPVALLTTTTDTVLKPLSNVGNQGRLSSRLVFIAPQRLHLSVHLVLTLVQACPTPSSPCASTLDGHLGHQSHKKLGHCWAFSPP